MKNKYSILVLIAVFTVFMSSCKKEYKVENSATVNTSGEWWVEAYENDDTTLLYSYEDIAGAMIISNTVANVNTEVLLDLPSAPFGPLSFKVKAPIDYANLSFKPAANLLNINDSTPTISIVGGKIWKNAATAPSKHKTDSIRLEVRYDGDETLYILKGYKDTGWPEDRFDH